MKLLTLILLTLIILLNSCYSIVSTHPVPKKGKEVKSFPHFLGGDFRVKDSLNETSKAVSRNEWIRIEIPNRQKIIVLHYDEYPVTKIEERWELDLEKSLYTQYGKDKVEIPIILRKKGNKYYLNFVIEKEEKYFGFFVIEILNQDSFEVTVSLCAPFYFNNNEKALNRITSFEEIEVPEGSTKAFEIAPTDKQLKKLLELNDFFDSYIFIREGV